MSFARRAAFSALASFFFSAFESSGFESAVDAAFESCGFDVGAELVAVPFGTFFSSSALSSTTVQRLQALFLLIAVVAA